MQALTEIPQLSPKLMDTLQYNSLVLTGRNNPITTLRCLSSIINSIMELGEIEHSGDWDPSLIITLKNGTHIETASGYPEFSLDDTYIKVFIYKDESSDDYQVIQSTIPVQDIQEISITAP